MPCTGPQKMPAVFVPDFKPPGINPQQPFDPRHQIGLRSLQHQMKMLGHQSIRVNLRLRLAASFRQRGRKSFPVGVIPKNAFAPVPAIHDVINRPFLFDSQPPGHPDI